jgi:hypothetical protein
MTVQELIEAFPRWVEQDPNVAGVFLVGSYARGEASPESDLDLVILTSRPYSYLSDTSWVDNFGSPSSVVLEDWGKVKSVRVHYSNGSEVEYGITTPDWATHPVPQSTQNVLADGMKLLLDRTGELEKAIRKIPDNEIQPTN